MTIILSEQDKVNALLQQKKIADLHMYMKAHNRWMHPGQWKVARALFSDKDKKQVVQVQCGRKFGKSFLAIYCAIRYGLENPGSIIYLIANTRKQGVGIYWTSQRLQRFAPKSLVHDIRETDYRLILESANDEGIHSQIIVEGCDNEQSLRGLNPDFVVYEEFRDHGEVFDTEVMRPNLAAKSASLLVISTPPDNECYYTKFTKEVRQKAEDPNSKYFYYEAPTSDNPHISKEWLESEKARLIASGQEAVWLREFEGKYIQGGATAVMPIWHKKKKGILKPYAFLKEYVKKDYKKIDWYTFSDPAQSTFAVLLLGHHRTTGQLIIFDEIYERDREQTSGARIWARVIQKRKDFIEAVDIEDWKNFYDPAASWFQVDVWDRYQEALIPAKKMKAKNERDLSSPISRLKDFFAQKDAVWIGSNCVGLIHELDVWSYTKEGKLPDVNDHCIDLLLYIFNNIHISVTPEIDIYLEDRLENEQSVRVPTINDLLKDAGFGDNYMLLENTLIEKENDDYGDGDRYGGEHYPYKERNRVSKKRVSFATD